MLTTAQQVSYSEKYLYAATPYQNSDFGAAAARRLRYALGWAMYQNGAYRKDYLTWAGQYLANQSLYRAIRAVYSPAYRLGEFWKMYLWGGQLDPAAGDGTATPSALPIVTDNEAIREFIAQVWTWSNWRANKDILGLYGTTMGDAFIKVIDDTAAGKVYFEIVHPSVIEDIEHDAWGNVKGYTITYPTLHPETGRKVIYKETCTRGPRNTVIFETFADNDPYAWNGSKARWQEAYGFVPMVHCQHNNIGLGWGLSEYHAARTKIQETDDAGSVLTDHIRRKMKAGWLLAGYTPTDSTSPVTVEIPSRYRAMSTIEKRNAPAPIREDEPFLYTSNTGAKPWPLVADTDLEGSVRHIQEVLADIERDYPELKFERVRAAADASGVALRVARQPAETKVRQRRAGYDDAMVRAHQMALSIGGFRGLFAGLNLDSYTAGRLDHYIGSRPVFAEDPEEAANIRAAESAADQAFWDAAGAAQAQGVQLPAFLRLHGWTDEAINALGIAPAPVQG